MTNTRLEHDLLGERNVPAEHYYGIQTLRAVENFSITGIPISHYPRLVHSLAYIKKSAAMANLELGLLLEPIARAIAQDGTGHRLQPVHLAGSAWPRLPYTCRALYPRYHRPSRALPAIGGEQHWVGDSSQPAIGVRENRPDC